MRMPALPKRSLLRRKHLVRGGKWLRPIYRKESSIDYHREIDEE